MVAGGEAGERCGAALKVLGVAERSGARFAAATRRLEQGERAGEDTHVEGLAAQLDVTLRGSSGETGRCAASGVAARGLCGSGGETAALCGQAK